MCSPWAREVILHTWCGEYATAAIVSTVSYTYTHVRIFCASFACLCTCMGVAWVCVCQSVDCSTSVVAIEIARNCRVQKLKWNELHEAHGQLECEFNFFRLKYDRLMSTWVRIDFDLHVVTLKSIILMKWIQTLTFQFKLSNGILLSIVTTAMQWKARYSIQIQLFNQSISSELIRSLFYNKLFFVDRKFISQRWCNRTQISHLFTQNEWKQQIEDTWEAKRQTNQRSFGVKQSPKNIVLNCVQFSIYCFSLSNPQSTISSTAYRIIYLLYQ